MNSKLLAALKPKTQVREITTQAAALEFLVEENRHIPAIVTNAAFTRKKASAAQPRKAAAVFVQIGGVAVFGCDVPNYTTPDEIHDLFTAFDLPWERGDYHRTTFKLNKAARYINPARLVPNYSQKALHLSNVNKNDAVYRPTRDSKIQSMVFAPEPIEDLTQTAAAFGRCQKGWVGYTGDVNAEDGTVLLTLAMCGLNAD